MGPRHAQEVQVIAGDFERLAQVAISSDCLRVMAAGIFGARSYEISSGVLLRSYSPPSPSAKGGALAGWYPSGVLI